MNKQNVVTQKTESFPLDSSIYLQGPNTHTKYRFSKRVCYVHHKQFEGYTVESRVLPNGVEDQYIIALSSAVTL